MRTTPPALRRVAASKKAARSRKKMKEALAARCRPDLEEKARAYVLELQKRPEVQNWDGRLLAFSVMFEPGPIDMIRFDGERWTYSYRVATKGEVRFMGATLCDESESFTVDVTPPEAVHVKQSEPQEKAK